MHDTDEQELTMPSQLGDSYTLRFPEDGELAQVYLGKRAPKGYVPTPDTFTD